MSREKFSRKKAFVQKYLSKGNYPGGLKGISTGGIIWGAVVWGRLSRGKGEIGTGFKLRGNFQGAVAQSGIVLIASDQINQFFE